MKWGGEKRRWEEGDKESRVLKMIEGQQRSDKTHQYCENYLNGQKQTFL